jgi:hypothetical protein
MVELTRVEERHGCFLNNLSLWLWRGRMHRAGLAQELSWPRSWAPSATVARGIDIFDA